MLIEGVKTQHSGQPGFDVLEEGEGRERQRGSFRRTKNSGRALERQMRTPDVKERECGHS